MHNQCSAKTECTRVTARSALEGALHSLLHLPLVLLAVVIGAREVEGGGLLVEVGHRLGRRLLRQELDELVEEGGRRLLLRFDRRPQQQRPQVRHAWGGGAGAGAPTGIDSTLATQAMTGPDVGFDPEQYTDEAKGFYVRLEDDGRPAEGSEANPQIISPQELEGLNLPDTLLH